MITQNYLASSANTCSAYDKFQAELKGLNAQQHNQKQQQKMRNSQQQQKLERLQQKTRFKK